MNNGRAGRSAQLTRVSRGDRLVVNLTNDISAIGMAHKSRHAKVQPMEMRRI